MIPFVLTRQYSLSTLEMTFKYFANPRAFAETTHKGCHFCKATQDCLGSGSFSGQEDIEAVCFECMAAGKLIDLDVTTNRINEADLDQANDPAAISTEITFCTPTIPTWQDCFWPIKNGKPYRFVKIASQIDYESKEQFVTTLFNCDKDTRLWDMLPEHKIENKEEGQYDVSFYLFDIPGDKLTIWDAS